MSYTVKEAVRVDIRINGEDASATYEPGDQELDPVIAELLVAQGYAVETTTTKKTNKTSTTDSALADTTNEGA